GRMSQDQFLLKWNNHQNNFVEVFNFLRTQDAFVDVTLACDGKSFSAHKVVLSACSPYFQTLFQTNPCKHPIVFLKDVKGQDMEALIEFIYKGEVSVSQTELGSLISTAENLKIKGLAEPERPLEKSVKRLASPPRIQGNAMPLQHAPITLFQQSSPSAKRKRTETYVSHCAYTNSRVSEKEEKLPPNALSADNGPSQVLLLPPQDSGTPVAPTDLTPQQATSYVTHHPSLSANNEAGGVLYSVAGSAIYNIKLEPTVSVPTEGWDGSNQSYEDGGAGSDGGGGGVSTPGGGGVIGSSSDAISLSLPLHSELTEPQLQDSSARKIYDVLPEIEVKRT
ncbi:Protein bric-a-brac 1, partial [Armadillidium nasatum]